MGVKCLSGEIMGNWKKILHSILFGFGFHACKFFCPVMLLWLHCKHAQYCQIRVNISSCMLTHWNYKFYLYLRFLFGWEFLSYMILAPNQAMEIQNILLIHETGNLAMYFRIWDFCMKSLRLYILDIIISWPRFKRGQSLLVSWDSQIDSLRRDDRI